MRKLCPNSEREHALETVLEVPLPDETAGFALSCNSNNAKAAARLKNVTAWMRAQIRDRSMQVSSSLSRGAELQLILGVIGAPLLSHPVRHHSSIVGTGIKDDPIEASMAKYIVQQYVAAAGGDNALGKVTSMYAMGKLHMKSSSSCGNSNSSRSGGETGGFVLWQQRPNLWCIELVVSGCKITAGSDGKVAWRQTPWQHAHASRGPPRPLRRCIQGLDPKSTADLFSDAIWVGEKTVSGHDCFVLRVDTEAGSLQARSSGQVEVVRHTTWGYFSQKTGLLVQIEDSHLLKIQGSDSKDSVFWETNMESSLGDYRTIEGVNIAHSGRTSASLLRSSGARACEGRGHTKSLMEETWEIEEVDFNIVGLSMDCFLPPADLKEQEEEKVKEQKKVKETKGSCDVSANNARPLGGVKAQGGTGAWFGPVRVMAIDSEDGDI
ncbi:DUF620 family protein (DUF620) [Rhynchospora pubera]|uniref:DUF620 family protein (DUF620) n=1 Tax=Rhynchospora pubera TaxID=906938 RepID=A0AAV8F118_9POAL|nr:DUF620 family protein (DUF620) [Rhynchospora pubera]